MVLLQIISDVLVSVGIFVARVALVRLDFNFWCTQVHFSIRLKFSLKIKMLFDNIH